MFSYWSLITLAWNVRHLPPWARWLTFQAIITFTVERIFAEENFAGVLFCRNYVCAIVKKTAKIRKFHLQKFLEQAILYQVICISFRIRLHAHPALLRFHNCGKRSRYWLDLGTLGSKRSFSTPGKPGKHPACSCRVYKTFQKCMFKNVLFPGWTNRPRSFWFIAPRKIETSRRNRKVSRH